MTELTPELNLIKGEDPDDSADYLTISLAQSLDILDGLFNASTGHNHNGAHQGGVLTFQNLTIGGTLTVNGALLAQGAATIQNTLLVTGATTLQSTLDVTGTTRLRGPVTLDSTLNVTGVATLPTLNTTTLNAQGITGTALQINGNSTVTGTESSGAVSTGTLTAAGRITGGTDMVINSGNIYLAANGDAMIQRAAADQLRVPSVVFFGPGVTDTYLQRSGPIGGQPHPLLVVNPGSGLWLLNEGLTFYTPTDPAGGGQTIRAIGPSSRPAATYGGGEVHIAIRLNVDGDIWAGTYVHGISFIQTSDPAVKQNMTGFTDADCMTRIRRPMPVYSYEIPPPVAPGEIAPTATDIGFDANDVYANNPEFAALNGSTPTGVNYANMSALLWGALRDLDARCAAQGI